ncbi:MAG: metallophosphoesterase family protein [Maricaulaceae bacterium]
MRIVHLSDLHFGAEAVVQKDALARWLDADPPDVLVASGDLTQTGARDEFEQARAFFAARATIKVLVPGNHDTPLLDVFARLTGPFRRFETTFDAFNVPNLVWDEAAFESLNTARGAQLRWNWSHGVVDLNALDAATERLRSAAPTGWRILVCHHPLIEPEGSPLRVATWNGAEAARRAAEAEVDVILCGHTHAPFVAPLAYGDQATRMVGAGTAFSIRTRGVEAGFVTLDLNGRCADVTVWRWRADSYAPLDRITFERRAHSNKHAAA